MKTFIHRRIGFWEIEELPESYSLGMTIEDYHGGKYVQLDASQIAFREAHPGASVTEVFNMLIPVPKARTIEQAKEDLKEQIKAYDVSPSVNTFLFNGQAMWFDASKRSQLMTSLISAQNRKDATVKFPVGDICIELPTATAFAFLDELNGDADQRTAVTTFHITEVEKLETIEDVDAYNYRIGYPKYVTINV